MNTTDPPAPFLEDSSMLPLALPQGLLDSAVRGTGLAEGTLADQLGPRPDALVFLRHFG